MTSLLEQRYRSALRMLPASYRQEWEEDMVATFLEAAHAHLPEDPEMVELGRPSRGELASIAGLAIRLRLGGLDAPPRSFVWGEAVRRVALIGLLVQAMAALAGIAMNLSIVARAPFIVIPADMTDLTVTRAQAWWMVAPLLGIAAYLSLVLGHWRWARWLAVVGFGLLVTGHTLDIATTDAVWDGARAYAIAFEALPVLALAAYHHTAPPIARRPWLTALPVGAVALFVTIVLAQPSMEDDILVDWPGLWCVGVVLAAATWFALAASGRQARHPHWPLALAILGIGSVGLRIPRISNYLAGGPTVANKSTVILIDRVEVAVTLAVSVALISYAIVSWRRLPVRPWRSTPAADPAEPPTAPKR